MLARRLYILISVFLLFWHARPDQGKNFDYYMVRDGESLRSIATKFNVDEWAVRESNPRLSSTGWKLRPGELLVIPTVGAQATVSPNGPQSEPEEFFSYHKVGSGEGWAVVAQRYGTDVDTLKRLNPEHSKRLRLRPGITLFVPNPNFDAPDMATALHWEKMKARYYWKPAPVPEPLLASALSQAVENQNQPGAVSSGVVAMESGGPGDPSVSEWSMLMDFGILGAQPAAVQARGETGDLSKRRRLSSRRGRNIYALLKSARGMLGVPYVWGGESPTGADCSGYVQLVFARHGVQLPRTADLQFNYGKKVPPGKEQPGDLVFFETYCPGPSHIGIYVGRRQFLHASSGAGQICLGSLETPYFKARYIGAKRHL